MNPKKRELASFRGVKPGHEELNFSAYHNIKPSRRHGGDVYQIDFSSPKKLDEIGLEFINYKVEIKSLELVRENQARRTVRGFSSRMLNKNNRQVILKNLPKYDDIIAVRVKAEGHENDRVAFTLSVFSPQGFSENEQGESLRLSKDLQQRQSVQFFMPPCLQADPQLSGIIFDVEKIRKMNMAEQRYFCRHFIPSFKKLLRQREEVANFLRSGENLEKPLVSVGRFFSYDRQESLLLFPLSLKESDFSTMAMKLKNYRDKKPQSARRGLSQENEQGYGTNLSYEEFMDSELFDSGLEYQENWGFEESHQNQENCQQAMMDFGVHSAQAKRYCQNTRGFEKGHISCMQFLSEQYILTSNAHHYCLEARGKMAAYRPCMGKLIELGLNHYDSNLFCQKTPEAYIDSQIECLEIMMKDGHSQYKAVRTCQKFSGQEQQLISCLQKKRSTSSNNSNLDECAPR